MAAVTVVLRVVVVLLLAAAVPVTVVRAAGLDRGFPLTAVVLVFPYAVAAAAGGTALAAALRRPVEGSVGGVALLVGLALLAPRVLPGPTPAVTPTGERLTVAVANLRLGQADAATVVAHVREHDVDVLVVLELTDGAVAALGAAGLSQLLPEHELLPSRLTSGGGIHSRLPLAPRPPDESRGFGATPRATITLPDGAEVDVDPVHPLPPVNARWAASWQEALATLPGPDADAPRILLGDFNASHDHRAFRALLGRGWVDAADATGAGLRTTFSALAYGEPVPPVTLDHVLVGPDVAVEEVVVAPLPGSDHRMLVARLRLPATA